MAKRETLIIDIGSASIGACTTTVGEKGKPILSSVSRTLVAGSGEGTRADLSDAVKGTVKHVLARLQKSSNPKVVHIVLASPWYQTRLKTIVSKAKKFLPISKSTVADLVENYHKKKKEESSAYPGSSKLESVVTQAYVNGYQTLIEQTLHGNVLKLELYEGFAPADFIQGLTDSVHEVFHDVSVHFHSFPLIAFVTLRSLRSEEGFTFIDVGGEVTDVAIVHKDGLRFLGSFPRGTNALLSDVSLGKERAEAASRLSLYVRGELSAEEGASFASLFQKSAQLWNEEYQKILEDAVADVPIPRTAFVIADRDELKWFEKVISQEGVKMFPVHPIALTPDFFQSLVSLGDGGLYDAFLSLEVLFFHTDQKELIDLGKVR